MVLPPPEPFPTSFLGGQKPKEKEGWEDPWSVIMVRFQCLLNATSLTTRSNGTRTLDHLWPRSSTADANVNATSTADRLPPRTLWNPRPCRVHDQIRPGRTAIPLDHLNLAPEAKRYRSCDSTERTIRSHPVKCSVMVTTKEPITNHPWSPVPRHLSPPLND